MEIWYYRDTKQELDDEKTVVHHRGICLNLFLMIGISFALFVSFSDFVYDFGKISDCFIIDVCTFSFSVSF